MTRARKTAAKSEASLQRKHSQFASRPFASRAEERESPAGESRVSFSLADIDIFPRETVQPKMKHEVLQGQMQESGRVLQAKEEARPNRTSMPDGLKSGLENISGMDLSKVRVHRNSPKPAHLNALAYTRGREIYVAPGQERHLPHEAWHVVQQAQGRVKPTMRVGSVAVNDDAGLEYEAGIMGMKALELSHIHKAAANPIMRATSIDSQKKNAYSKNTMNDRTGVAETRKNTITQGGSSGSNVTQAVWVQARNTTELYWDVLLSGLQWFYNNGSFYYHIVDDLAVPIDVWSNIEMYEGQQLTEEQIDTLGFQKILDNPEIVEDASMETEGSGMVSRSVADKIIENLQRGIYPFKPELGLGGCSWFIWKGEGIPYTSINKVKKGEEPKDIPINATIQLPAHPLIFTTEFLAQRHDMYMNDESWKKETEGKWRDFKKMKFQKLSNRNLADLTFYRKGLAEHKMWVSIGQMVANHPSRVGVVILSGSDFSKEGNGKFLVVADRTKIKVKLSEVTVAAFVHDLVASIPKKASHSIHFK